MEEMKLHNRTHWLYTHFFHFFDIPHFLSYNLIKKFLKHWNKLFNTRDKIDDAITEKEQTINDINIDEILDKLDKIIYENTRATSEFESISDRGNNNLDTLVGSENNFESMLKDIISWQENYEWKTS